jgi:hypothetical protein
MQDTSIANDTWLSRRSARVRASIAAALVAAALSLGIGLAVLGALVATASVAAGGLGMAYSACQRIEVDLASDLGLSVAALKSTNSAELSNLVGVRHTAGALTTIETRHATDSTAAYANCRQVFGEVAPDRPESR